MDIHKLKTITHGKESCNELMMQLVKKAYHRSSLSRKQNQGGNVEQMRKDPLTYIAEKILEKICLKNTKSNQAFISAMLGYLTALIIIFIYEFVFK